MLLQLMFEGQIEHNDLGFDASNFSTISQNPRGSLDRQGETNVWKWNCSTGIWPIWTLFYSLPPPPLPQDTCCSDQIYCTDPGNTCTCYHWVCQCAIQWIWIVWICVFGQGFDDQSRSKSRYLLKKYSRSMKKKWRSTVHLQCTWINKTNLSPISHIIYIQSKLH